MIDEFNEHHTKPESQKPLEATDLQRLDVYTPEFQQRLKELKQLEEISARIGTANKATQTAERVLYEVGQIAPPEVARNCGEHVFQWFTDKNPYRIDAVMVICNEQGIEPTPTIIKLATEVAKSRTFGQLAGRSDKLIKESIKSHVFKLMLNLIYHGESLKDAADKAAQWKRDNYPDIKDFKASSLEKEYSGKFRRKTKFGDKLEDFYFARWDKYQTAQQRAQWLRITNDLPIADEDLLGVRR